MTTSTYRPRTKRLTTPVGAQTSFRLTEEMLERIRALVPVFQTESPGFNITQGDVIREALEIGVLVLEGDSSAGAP